MIGLVLYSLLAVSAAGAEQLDCRQPEKGHPRPAGADFSSWKWHATIVANRRAQCFLKQHPLLANEPCDGQWDLASCSLTDSQLKFETHRTEYDRDYAKAGAQARRTALLGWKAEAVRFALDRIEERAAALRPKEIKVENDDSKTQETLAKIAGDGQPPAPAPSRPSAGTLAETPNVSPKYTEEQISAPSETSGGPTRPIPPSAVAPPPAEKPAAKPAVSAGMLGVIGGVRNSIVTAEQSAGALRPEVRDRLVAIGLRESSGNPAAVGDSGNSIGMFQMQRATAMGAGCTDARWRSGDAVCAVRHAAALDKKLSARYGGDWAQKHPEWLGLNWNLGEGGFRTYLNQTSARVAMLAQRYLDGEWGLTQWRQRVAATQQLALGGK